MKDLITERTAIPISLVILTLGATYWVTCLYSEVKVGTSQISDMKILQMRRDEMMERILQRLSSIENELKHLNKAF